MLLCDREGKVYDVWITFGSMHEVRAFRERKKRSVWFRELVVFFTDVVASQDGIRDRSVSRGLGDVYKRQK